jgi:beta-glucosidase
VDRAVSRILALKFRLGLFERPYVQAEAAARIFDMPIHRELALEAARKSIILLKNEGNLLPLDKNIRRIAVIGPNADSCRNLMGDYAYPSNAGYEMVPNPDSGKMDVVWKDESARQDRVDTPVVVSVLQGIRAKVSKNTDVLTAKGCDYSGESEDGLAEAVKVAGLADVTVLVVGGKSGLLPECTSGEMRDRAELGLLGVQEKLVRVVQEIGKPVVLVLVDGRPCALGWMAEKLPAIVEAWLPGEEGGRAVADVLFGDHNPGGKLPVSFPEKPGQIPAYYGHKPSGRRSSAWGDYVDGSPRPLFEFGYGLSYTTFAFSGLAITPDNISPEGAVSIAVDVENTGNRAGDEVVQLYVNDVVASVTRPVKELRGFRRLYLEAGERRTVEFRLSAGDVALFDRSMKRVVEPGVFKIMVGRSSSDILLEGEFLVRGGPMAGKE